MQIIGQELQPRRLTLVHFGIALGVVAYENFAECRIESFNVFGKIFAIFEVELSQAALLRGTGAEVFVFGAVM